LPTSWVDTRTTIGALLVALAKLPNQAAEPCLRLQNAVTAAATGAAVGLSARIGGDAVFLATIDARVPLGLPEPGSRVPPGTAPARVHTEIGCPAPIVDAGGYLAHINCVAVAVPLGRGQVAAVTTLVAGQAPAARVVGCHPSRRHPNRRTTGYAAGLDHNSGGKLTQRALGRR